MLNHKAVVEDLHEILDDLVSDAEKIGVEVELDMLTNEEEAVIWLSSIERIQGKPGAGAEVISLLKDIAADHGCIIEGQIDGPASKLAAYYRLQEFDIEIRSTRTIITYRP